YIKAAQAVVWVDEAAKKQTGVYRLTVYAENGVLLEVESNSYNAPSGVFELSTRGQVSGKLFHSKRAEKALPADPLYQRAVAPVPPPGPAPRPPGADKPPPGPPPTISIRPRSSQKPKFDSYAMPNGETVGVFSPGVIISITDPKVGTPVEIAADRVVFWTKGD